MAERLISASGHVTETTRECYSAKSRLQSARTWWTCLESQSDRHHREAERPTAGNNGLRRTSRNILPKIALLMHRLHSSTSRRNWTSGRGRYEQIQAQEHEATCATIGRAASAHVRAASAHVPTPGNPISVDSQIVLDIYCVERVPRRSLLRMQDGICLEHPSWSIRIVSPVPRCKRWPPVPQSLATCRTNMVTFL